MKIAATLAAALVLLPVATAAAEDAIPLPPEGFYLLEPEQQHRVGGIGPAAEHLNCSGIYDVAAMLMRDAGRPATAEDFDARAYDAQVAGVVHAYKDMGDKAAEFAVSQRMGRRAFWLSEVRAEEAENAALFGAALDYCMSALGEEQRLIAERARQFPPQQ